MGIKHSPKLLVVVFALMFVAIMASSKWLTGWRVDLSENGLYTLSEGTKRILTKLEQPVTLSLYFSDKASKQLPALRTYAQRVEELLEEYETLANGKVILQKIDPVPFSEAEDEAAMAGLQGVPAGARSDEIYFGLVARNEAGAEEVIPFMQPDKEAFLEYELTRLISSLSKTSTLKVGVISGIEINGGFDYMTRQQRPAWSILQFIEEGFELSWIDDDATEISGVDVLLLIAPQHLSDALLFAIDQYVLSGGRTIVFLDAHSEAFAGQSGVPSVQRSDLAALLPSWGIKLREEHFVTDYENSMVVGVGPSRNPVRHIGLLGMTPETIDGDDIILFGLESLNWSSAGILDTLDEAESVVTPLVMTSPESQPRKTELLLDLHDPQALLSEFAPTGERYILAARVTGKAKTAFPDGVEVEVADPDSANSANEEQSATDTEAEAVKTQRLMPAITETDKLHVLVATDTDFLSDRLWVQVQNFFGQQIVSPWADNGSFLMNALEHMSGHPDLIEIRSQGRFNRPFEKVEALRREAEERFLAQQEVLEEELRSTEERLIELEKLRDGSDAGLFTPEQEAELMNFQAQKLKIRKQLRDVQHQLDQDIEALGTKLKLINIFLIPLLICILALLAAARHRFA